MRSTVVVDEWFGLKAAVELDLPALLATSRLPRNKSCSFASCLAQCQLHAFQDRIAVGSLASRMSWSLWQSP